MSEIVRELRTVVLGRASIADGILPPAVFGVANALAGARPAVVTALACSALIIALRLARRKPLKFAIAGLAGVVVGSIATIWRGPDGFLLPALASGAGLTFLIGVSIVFRRPFVAWTSWLARDWPLGWYWHPRVRPAYTAVTWLWLLFFAFRTAGQWLTLERTGTAVLYRVVTGWPAITLLLIGSYVVGRRLLSRLGGPSVQEWREGAPEPWQGQPTGF